MYTRHSEVPHEQANARFGDIHHGRSKKERRGWVGCVWGGYLPLAAPRAIGGTVVRVQLNAIPISNRTAGKSEADNFHRQDTRGPPTKTLKKEGGKIKRRKIEIEVQSKE
jgi:hypothetical protein